MSHPRRTPFSMYSAIFACSIGNVSDGERNSATKSGAMCENLTLSSSGTVPHRSRNIHEASGARIAPLGRVHPDDESKLRPVPSCFDQMYSCPNISPFCQPSCHIGGRHYYHFPFCSELYPQVAVVRAELHQLVVSHRNGAEVEHQHGREAFAPQGWGWNFDRWRFVWLGHVGVPQYRST